MQERVGFLQGGSPWPAECWTHRGSDTGNRGFWATHDTIPVLDNVQTPVDPAEIRLLPIGVPHHGRLAALREAGAHPASDLLQPRGLRVAIQVVIAIIGEGPGARLIVIPADPRGRRCEGRDRSNRWSKANEVGQRFSKQPRGICPRFEPGPIRDKGFRRGGHRAQRVWPGEGFRTREAGGPEVALDVDAGLDSVGGWPCLDNNLAAIR
jgi:hypothetical protein